MPREAPIAPWYQLLHPLLCPIFTIPSTNVCPQLSSKLVIAHSCNAGSIARERATLANSCFTGALLLAIDTWGHELPLMGLLAHVSDEVMHITGNRQKPVPIGTVGEETFLVDVLGRSKVPGSGTYLKNLIQPLQMRFEEQVCCFV
jgi:hypothetical protein